MSELIFSCNRCDTGDIYYQHVCRKKCKACNGSGKDWSTGWATRSIPDDCKECKGTGKEPR